MLLSRQRLFFFFYDGSVGPFEFFFLPFCVYYYYLKFMCDTNEKKYFCLE